MTGTLLVRDGVLWSDGARLAGDAVLVVDGRIRALGDGDVLAARDDAAGAQMVDAAGGLVHPSFADAHVHTAMGGLESIGLDVSGAHGAEACLARVAAYAAEQDGPWIVGGGWHMADHPGGTPTAAALDAVTGDVPAFLVNADHHGAWVNTAALRAAGIDASTPDPEDGRIERDAAGNPTGTLHEGAMSLVSAHLPTRTDDELRAGLAAGADALLRAGVTAWQEAIVGDYGGHVDASPTYGDLIEGGVLAARVSGALWVPRDVTLDTVPAVVADLARRRDRDAARGFDTATVKIMVDGVAENRTAALAEPYLVDGCDCAVDGDGDGRGIAYFGRDVLFAVAAAAAAEGFALHFHAIGDRAVTDALDAVEALPAAVRGRRRHHIAHVQVVDPVDVPRFAALGVTVNMQALWACSSAQVTELTLPILGARRAAWQYPFGSFLRAGAALAMGSDWPVSTYDPWQAIHVAVTRQAPGSDAEPLLPDEALPLDVALRAYTAGSHRLLGLGGEGGSGTLEVGARADVCVASRDPFAGDPRDIASTRTAVTVLDGRIVHREAAAPAAP
ncbi:amidohydrolase [Demequina sp. SYSU T00192]|uniref:Amidohydrolase n=1 Tax=Demequina litoralis TaxID=3051660 RepID=A0ABT8GA70_9MICO|nr:amidohydrolase [Demequina sp. SYSU T00192]MDN4475962.1 amidohydrolase [Demequina sp. SYSU T00192]